MKCYELLREKDKVFYLSIKLCEKIAEKIDCKDCPFTDRCRQGHNGVFDYLMEEVVDFDD